MKAKPSGPTAEATAIAVAPGPRAVTVRPDRDVTITARALIVVARPEQQAARPGPKASVAGPSAARDPTFAGASPASSAHRRRCRK